MFESVEPNGRLVVAHGLGQLMDFGAEPAGVVMNSLAIRKRRSSMVGAPETPIPDTAATLLADDASRAVAEWPNTVGIERSSAIDP